MKIVALICRHELTILARSDPHKSRETSIVENRNDAHEIEYEAGTRWLKFASAIAWLVEILC